MNSSTVLIESILQLPNWIRILIGLAPFIILILLIWLVFYPHYKEAEPLKIK